MKAKKPHISKGDVAKVKQPKSLNSPKKPKIPHSKLRRRDGIV